MKTINRIADSIETSEASEIRQIIARTLMVDKTKIMPFADSNEFTSELFKLLDTGSQRLLNIGHLAVETAIAADKAQLEVIELLGKSPFSTNISTLIDNQTKEDDIIYLTNPCKITGSNYSLADIEKVAKAVPRGTVIVDEFYFDFFGISALPLIDIFTNVIILRSFTAPFGVYSSDAGYAITGKEMTAKIKCNLMLKNISSILRKTILATLLSEDAMTSRLQEIHDESLRISTALSKLGIQSRITATDFLLIRVASPKDVGNSISANKITLENLDGYPMMKGYIKYRIESYFTNDRLINSFRKMQPSYYKLTAPDHRTVTIRNGSQSFKNKPVMQEDSKISNNRFKKLIKSEAVVK